MTIDINYFRVPTTFKIRIPEQAWLTQRPRSSAGCLATFVVGESLQLPAMHAALAQTCVKGVWFVASDLIVERPTSLRIPISNNLTSRPYLWRQNEYSTIKIMFPTLLMIRLDLCKVRYSK